MYASYLLLGVVPYKALLYNAAPQFVLKRSANMNGDRYECMVKKHFASWKKKMFPRKGKTKIALVKDFEALLPWRVEIKELVARVATD